MLIQPPTYSYGDVVTLKLLGGDEVIGKLLEETETTTILDRPLCVVPTQNAFQFFPFVMTAKENVSITLKSSAIISVVPTHAGIAKEYQKYTSNLILP